MSSRAASQQGVSERERRLAMARQVLASGEISETGLPTWIASSWQRCLSQGRRPQDRVGFDMVSPQSMARALDRSQALRTAAVPVLTGLRQAMAATGYFAILTDEQGVVVSVDGPIDRRQREVEVIARVGVDLSEQAVGTTAIGSALREQMPVWLHRGEHFFEDTAVYSCAGAPIFGPHGELVGMLDLTGVLVPERAELRHLVARAAQNIEQEMMAALPHALALRFTWAGLAEVSAQGVLTLDEEGYLVAANRTAREMLGLPSRHAPKTCHVSEWLAMSSDRLFDWVGNLAPVELPIWSGLNISARILRRLEPGHQPAYPSGQAGGLRDIETHLIRRAVAEARGNVKLAAERLGISRATIYRKLSSRKG